MQPIRFAGFLGAIPSRQPRLLADSLGVLIENHKPGSGDLAPWKVPLDVATVPAGRKTLYRFNADARSDTNYWFSATTRVHYARAAIADDPSERTYYTEGGQLRVTDSTLALAGAPYPTAYRQGGLPAPLTAPTLTQVTAGTGDDETRYYAYCYVNDWGQVSAPSPISAAFTCKPGAVITIGGLAAVPSGSHGINRIWVFRTQAAASGVAEFFFLREITTPATSTTDDARALNFSQTMESAGPAGTLGRQWAEPPAGMSCLAGLWNGMMAAIVGKAVRICEPYKHYAWPPAFEVAPTAQPVALAAFGKSLVILTTATPLVVYGSTPEALDGPPIDLIAPCVSEPSVVTFEHGVCWASADGLAYLGAAGAPVILTKDILTPEAWRAMAPTTMVGCQHNGLYFGFYDTGFGWKGFYIDPAAPSGLFTLSAGYPAAYFDRLQKQMYVLSGTSIQKFDAGATAMTVTARSKVFRQPKPVNPAVAEVVADQYPVTFKLWAGRYGASGWPAGSLKVTRTVNDRASFKLPSGYLGDDFQVELSSTGPVTAAAVAGSVTELRDL